MDTSNMKVDVFDFFKFDDWVVVFKNGVFFEDNHYFNLADYLHRNQGTAAVVNSSQYIDLPEGFTDYIGLDYSNSVSLEEFRLKCENGSIFATDSCE